MWWQSLTTLTLQILTPMLAALRQFSGCSSAIHTCLDAHCSSTAYSLQKSTVKCAPTVCCYMQCSVFVLISNAFRECLCTAQCADDRPVEFTRQNHRSRMSMTTTGLTGSQDIAPANSTAKAVWQQYEILPAWWGVGTKSKLQLDFVTAPLSFLFRMEPCICVCLYL